ncbi:zinc finger and BTB domain-containing protein 24-like [Penaeus indicus]|uniref:zinc finger and BTB domain-containing protein 24-like n=1 Tax=Penaeus indicus TaxID=29960 RepID=UPI00300D9FD5
MSFLADWMPLAPPTDKEIFSTGVSIKEELTEYISEDTCVEIKDEQFDYADKERDEVKDVKVTHGCFSVHNLHDMMYEAKEKDSYNLDRDDMLGTPLIAAHYGHKRSSDRVKAKHKESRIEDTNHINNDIEFHRQEKPYTGEHCNKVFSSKFSLGYHMRPHTKEKPYSCEICNKAFI